MLKARIVKAMSHLDSVAGVGCVGISVLGWGFYLFFLQAAFWECFILEHLPFVVPEYNFRMSCCMIVINHCKPAATGDELNFVAFFHVCFLCCVSFT